MAASQHRVAERRRDGIGPVGEAQLTGVRNLHVKRQHNNMISRLKQNGGDSQNQSWLSQGCCASAATGQGLQERQQGEGQQVQIE